MMTKRKLLMQIFLRLTATNCSEMRINMNDRYLEGLIYTVKNKEKFSEIASIVDELINISFPEWYIEDTTELRYERANKYALPIEQFCFGDCEQFMSVCYILSHIAGAHYNKGNYSFYKRMIKFKENNPSFFSEAQIDRMCIRGDDLIISVLTFMATLVSFELKSGIVETDTYDIVVKYTGVMYQKRKMDAACCLDIASIYFAAGMFVEGKRVLDNGAFYIDMIEFPSHREIVEDYYNAFMWGCENGKRFPYALNLS